MIDCIQEVRKKDRYDYITEVCKRIYARDERGRFAPTSGGRKSPKYAPSRRANRKGITVAPKTFGILRGQFNTKYPGLGPKDGAKPLHHGGYLYRASADGAGSIIIHSKIKNTK